MDAVRSVAEAVAAEEAKIPHWFRVQMARLGGLKFCPSTLLTHWQAVQRLAPEDALEPMVERGVGRLQVGTNFPSAWLLTTATEEARSLPEIEDRTTLLANPVYLGTLPTGTPIYAKREWKYHCDDCNDSGWLSVWCGPGAKPWHISQDCRRLIEHGPHEWVMPCPCADHNPDVQRRKERQRMSVRSNEKERE